MARKMKVDFTGVESYQRVSEGIHRAKISEIQEKTSQGGDQMLQVAFEVIKGDDKGNKVFDSLVLTDKALWKFKSLLQVLNMKCEGKVAVDLDNMIGKVLDINVIHEEYNGVTRAKISEYTKANDSKSSVDDDDDEDEHEHHHHHHHDHDEDDHDCCCHHHHDEDDDEDEHEHHHHDHDDDDHDHDCCHHHDDEDEHEHHHEHHYDEHGVCSCGHHHHHDHDADEVFTSWGKETAHKYSREDLDKALHALDEGAYGMILRAKGIVDGGDTWYEFDMVPGEHEIRPCGPDVTGKLCVIGSQLKEHEIAELFHV